MKKTLFISFLLLIFLSIPYKAEASGLFTIGSINYVIDGQQQTMDVTPYIENNRTFLPVRFGAHALGITDNNIFWDDSNQKVSLMKGNIVVQLQIGSYTMLDNGTSINMDVAPEITQDRVMLPLGYIANAFGQNVSWDPTSQTVTIGDITQNNTSYTPPVNTPSQTLYVTVPSLSYSNIQVESKDFTWTYAGNNYKWHVEVPEDFISWDRQINNITQRYYNSDGLTQDSMYNSMQENIRNLIVSDSISNPNLTPWVNESGNVKWTGYIADAFSKCAKYMNLDYFHTAEFAQSFVGGAIPYQLTECPELAAQTVFDNGDCKDKSILLASILKNAGYKVALIYYPAQPGESTGHMAVGVVFDDSQVPTDRNVSYYLHDGLKYYFAETTEPDWLMGQVSDEKLEKQGYVFPVN